LDIKRVLCALVLHPDGHLTYLARVDLIVPVSSEIVVDLVAEIDELGKVEK
jgi:hypothetical protein